LDEIFQTENESVECLDRLTFGAEIGLDRYNNRFKNARRQGRSVKEKNGELTSLPQFARIAADR